MANKVIKHYYEEAVSCGPPYMPNTEVDKTKVIAELSKVELANLISRLRLEREAEQLILDLRRNSGEKWDYDNPPKVDTKTPVNQLYHEGVLGMRWGVRRFQNRDGTRTALGKKRREGEEENPPSRPSEDHNQSQLDRKHATQGLSNAELKRLNDRMQLEKTYRELTAAEKKRNESFGKSILKEIAKNSLTEAGKELGSGLLKQFIVKPILNSVDNKK
jgi:hypothetical protein